MATINPKLAARIAALRAAKEQASGDSRSASVTETETVEEKANGTNSVRVVTPDGIRRNDSGNTTTIKVEASTQVTAIPTPQPHTFKPSVVSIEGAGEYEPFKMKLAELEQQLDEQVPGFATTLRDIHRAIGQDANIVTVLSEDEIALIVKGLAKHMDTTVVVAKKTSSKRTQPVSADDL